MCSTARSLNAKPLAALQHNVSQEHKKSCKTTYRRVHFNNYDDDTVQVSVREIASRSEYTKMEKNDTWYQQSDYDAIDATLKAVARGIHEREAYECPKYSYSNVLLAAYKSCVSSNSLSEKDMKCLCYWTAYGHSRRGLERLSIPAFDCKQYENRHGAIQAVIKIQNTYSKIGMLATGDKSKSDIIASAYSRLTQGSANFAALMGKVDHRAVCGSFSLSPQRQMCMTGQAASHGKTNQRYIALGANPILRAQSLS